MCSIFIKKVLRGRNKYSHHSSLCLTFFPCQVENWEMTETVTDPLSNRYAIVPEPVLRSAVIQLPEIGVVLWCHQRQFCHHPVELEQPTFPPCLGHSGTKLWLLQLPQYHPPPATRVVQQESKCDATAAGAWEQCIENAATLLLSRCLTIYCKCMHAVYFHYTIYCDYTYQCIAGHFPVPWELTTQNFICLYSLQVKVKFVLNCQKWDKPLVCKGFLLFIMNYASLTLQLECFV